MCNMRSINNNFIGAHILSIDQFTREDIETVFEKAKAYRTLLKTGTPITDLTGRVLCALFYEPSSRTFGSFITSMQRLGGGFIPIQGVQFSSVSKGETLEDTIQVFGNYADAIALRHSEKGGSASGSRRITCPYSQCRRWSG